VAAALLWGCVTQCLMGTEEAHLKVPESREEPEGQVSNLPLRAHPQ
jgi:hypothetical protein